MAWWRLLMIMMIAVGGCSSTGASLVAQPPTTTPEPTATSEPTATPVPTVSTVEFTNDNWGLALSSADAYKGAVVNRLSGRIFIEERGDNFWTIQVFTDPERS